MESELVHQAAILFGAPMTERLQARAADPDHTTTVVAEDSTDASTEVVVNGQPAADVTLDNTPPLLKLNMTSRQQRKLWRHVEAIENFWETLAEPEPGVVERLAAMAAE